MTTHPSSQGPLRILMAAGVPRRREAGAAAIIYQLAERYRRLGHSVDCLFLEDLGPYDNVPARLRDLAYSFRLANHIRENGQEYSVVNLHAPWGYAYARKRRRRRGSPPYVLTMQGAEERYVYAMRREAEKGRAQYFRWRNRLWHRAFHLRMYRGAIRGADYAITANREAAASLQLRHGMDAERVWFVPNGVDESFFVERSPGDGTRLLFVGTWLDRKGIYYLRDAFVRIATRNPKARLTVAGCITEEPEVRRWFPATVQERLRVLPFVRVDEMPRVYAEHDVFVLPSLMEGMPLSLLEAMACGLAVVTTDTCGMPDVVEDGYNGLLVKPACEEKLLGAVERLINDSVIRARLGDCARLTAERYTWDKVGAKYLAVLRLAAGTRE